MTIFRIRYGRIVLFLISILFLWSNSSVVYDWVQPNIIGVGKLRYLIFFTFGVFAKTYLSFFERMLANRWTMTFLIPLFVMSVMLDFHTSIMPETIKFVMCGCMGLIIVFYFFKCNEKSFAKNTFIGRGLQYIGKRTLDVYLLHYFFLPQNLHKLGSFFTGNQAPTLELFITLILGLLVIFLCLVVSNVIRLSPLLAHWLLGVKFNR